MSMYILYTYGDGGGGSALCLYHLIIIFAVFGTFLGIVVVKRF